MSSIVDTASVKPVKTAKQSRQMRFALFVLIALVIGVAVAYRFLIPSQAAMVVNDYQTATVIQQDIVQTAQASGTTQIPAQMIIRSPKEGYSESLIAALGQEVVKGNELAIISVPDLDESIEDLEADLLNAQLSLQKIQLQNKNAIENHADSQAQFQADIAELEAEVSKYQQLVAINNARQSDLDAAIDKLADKREQLSDSERQYKQAQAIFLLDEASSQAKAAQIQVRLNRLLAEKEGTTIVSTMTGEILDIADELNVPGSTIDKGKALFTVADPSSAVFDLEISEEYSSLIAIGDSVPVTVGSAIVNSRISSIGKLAQSSSDGLGATVQVTVKPEQTGNYLAGSTAIGIFTLGVKEDALTLPRGAYLTTGAQKYVYVLTDEKHAEKRTVTFGEIEGNTVQINSGLSAGDEVIISGYENFISEPTIKLAGE